MQQIQFPFDPLEFRDRVGIYRQVFGCSLLGRVEFWNRLQKLAETLERSPNVEIDTLYCEDEQFRRNCDRCLELNGIDPDWLDSKGVMLSGLLFSWQGNEALLVKLNTPDNIPEELKSEPSDGGADFGEYGQIASLWAAEGSLDKALEIANKHPAKLVERVLMARSDQAVTPEERKQAKRRAQSKKAQEEIGADILGFMGKFGKAS